MKLNEYMKFSYSVSIFIVEKLSNIILQPVYFPK